MNEKTQVLWMENIEKIKAKDIMSKFAITTTEDTTVADLAHLMMRFKISGMPVISSKGETCGVVTATDLFKLMNKITYDFETDGQIKNYCDFTVGEIMTSSVLTIDPEMSLLKVMTIMCSKNIHTLPVMQENKTIGIIGRRDVMNACYVTANSELKL